MDSRGVFRDGVGRYSSSSAPSEQKSGPRRFLSSFKDSGHQFPSAETKDIRTGWVRAIAELTARDPDARTENCRSEDWARVGDGSIGAPSPGVHLDFSERWLRGPHDA